jgi:hypothetical protein
VSTPPPPWPPLLPGPPPARLPPHPRATTSLVLGVVALGGFFLVLPLVLSPLAWYFGAVAQREVEREPARWRPSGEARAGLVLGVIGSVLLAVLLLAGALVLVLGLFATRYDAGYGT